MDALGISEQVLKEGLRQTRGLAAGGGPSVLVAPPPMPKRPGTIPVSDAEEWRQRMKNRRVKLGDTNQPAPSGTPPPNHRALSARYKVRFGDDEIDKLRIASTAVSYPIASLVSLAGLGRIMILWRRIAEPPGKPKRRRHIIEISINDTVWDDLMQRIALAQPPLASGRKPVDFSSYFRMAVFGLLEVPKLGERERSLLLRPLYEERVLAAAQAALWTAQECSRHPATLPRIAEAGAALRQRIEAGKCLKADQEGAVKLLRTVARLAKDTELGWVSQARWEDVVTRINNLAKEQP